jgi:hypothetical protein
LASSVRTTLAVVTPSALPNWPVAVLMAADAPTRVLGGVDKMIWARAGVATPNPNPRITIGSNMIQNGVSGRMNARDSMLNAISAIPLATHIGVPNRTVNRWIMADPTSIPKTYGTKRRCDTNEPVPCTSRLKVPNSNKNVTCTALITMPATMASTRSRPVNMPVSRSVFR